MPAKVSPALRATRMWPSSVWFMPKIERPRTIETHADAGAHGDVGEVIEPTRGAPTAFSERRAIHVGVEAHGHAQAPA